MAKQTVRIGELLVDAEVLTAEQLGEALRLQKDSGLRLGSVLIQRGFVTEPQLIQALSKQLSIPWVSLWHLDISEQLLDMIPEDVVVESGVLPIYIRSLRDGNKALYVAMDNPGDSELLETIADSCGLSVKPMIAGPSEIANAIYNYYGRRWRGAPMPTERRVSSVPPPAPHEDPEPEDEILLEEEAEEQEVVELEEQEVEEQEADDDELPEDEDAIELTETVDESEETEEQEAEPAGEPAATTDLFAPAAQETAQPRSKKFQRWRPSKINLTFLDGTSVALGKDKDGKPQKSADEILQEIGALSLEGEEGKKLSLAVKGILKTLIKRGMLTEQELHDIIKGE